MRDNPTQKDPRTKVPTLVLRELEAFPTMPDSAFVRLPTVSLLFSVSGATIWRQVADGTIPAPRKLGANTTRWNVGEIRARLSELATAPTVHNNTEAA